MKNIDNIKDNKYIDQDAIAKEISEYWKNNFDGEVQVNDTFHCEAEEDGCDTIFGTNDSMITVKINHTNECSHGCFDCEHFDGGNCINSCSNHYSCEGGIAAEDCNAWSNGE